MNKLLIIVAIVLTFGVGFVLMQRQNSSQPALISQPTPTFESNEPKDVDYKAGFAIFTYGTFRVFTAPMYHNLSADVYIQADNPNVVTVKKRGITWGDFFSTLPMKLTKDCLTTGTRETFCSGANGALQFYLNGVKTDNLLDLEILNGDRALITFGNVGGKQLQDQLQKIPMVQ